MLIHLPIIVTEDVWINAILLDFLVPTTLLTNAYYYALHPLITITKITYVFFTVLKQTILPILLQDNVYLDVPTLQLHRHISAMVIKRLVDA